MQGFEQNGCPTTQVSASPTTCQRTSPPSCLAEFNGVDEDKFDVGLMRLNNNQPFGGVGVGPRGTCAKAGPTLITATPVATDYNYQLPTLNANNPRLLTIFVVPDGSFKYSDNNAVNMTPILGYASFYLAGWDHDPCETASNPSCPTVATAPAPVARGPLRPHRSRQPRRRNDL